MSRTPIFMITVIHLIFLKNYLNKIEKKCKLSVKGRIFSLRGFLKPNRIIEKFVPKKLNSSLTYTVICYNKSHKTSIIYSTVRFRIKETQIQSLFNLARTQKEKGCVVTVIKFILRISCLKIHFIEEKEVKISLNFTKKKVLLSYQPNNIAFGMEVKIFMELLHH